MRCWTMRWQSWRLSRRACRPCRQRRWEPSPSEGQPKTDSRPSCKISTWRVRVSTPARHWLMRWAPFRKANKRTQDTNQAWMLNHTLQPLEVSAWVWPDDLRQALERGPWSWMTPRTSPTWGTSRRSTSPTSGGSETHRTRGTRRRCWKRCPIWRHRPPPKLPLVLGGTSQCHRRTWIRRRVSCPCSSGQ